MAKKNDLKDIKDAAKVAKKTAGAAKKTVNTAKKGKQIIKRTGFQAALPYISILLSIVLGACLILVGIADNDHPALVLFHQIFCGLFGGAAYFIPLVLLFTGIIWAALYLKYKKSDGREGSERLDEYKSANKKTISKTVLCLLEILMLSIIFGIAYNLLDIGNEIASFSISDAWEISAVDATFISGGIIGSAFAFLLSYLYSGIWMFVLIVLFISALMAICGITPQYIHDKIKYSRELDEDLEDYNEEAEERRAEMLRASALEKAKKRRQRERIAEQKRQAKEYAKNYNFEEELQPLDPNFESNNSANEQKNDKKKNTPKSKAVAENKNEVPVQVESSNDDVDILLGGISLDTFTDNDNSVDDDDDDNNEIILTEVRNDESIGRNFGGDEIIDGTPSVEELLEGIGEPKTGKPQKDEPLELSEIGNGEREDDFKDIIPEKIEEVVQEEIALPYVFPPIELLSVNKNSADPNMQAELQENAKILKDTLKSFKVQIREISYSRGPTVTRYEIKPEVGTKVKSIANLVDDIAYSLATSGVRIEAPIPNKSAVGIEVPNRHPEVVYLRDLIESTDFTDTKSRVTACLGKDIGGNNVYFDIAKMPHLLIAGATGMGKSVCINCVIVSLLYKARPEELKLILIDPKKVEFAPYKDIPHLYAPIVTDPKKAAGALASAVVEMERRFELIENAGVRNIQGYNESIADDPTQEKLPLIVIIIDELADLMMTAGKDVETCICRLTQKARAAGIHLIIGTQRPSVDVITGLIKANIPSRIACTVASQIDSRTILDLAGAEKLIGRGDMLFAPVGSSKPNRVQGAFVSDSEVEDIVNFVKMHNSAAKYDAAFISTMESSAKTMGMKKGEVVAEESSGSSGSKSDSKFDEAVKIAIESGKISTSLLQRRLSIGFGRAGKIIDLMEEKGYVGPANGSKPREVLITMDEYLARKASGDDEDEDEE